MSANTLIDLGGGAQLGMSLGGQSGLFAPASGALIGQSIDLINANNYCNVVIAGQCMFLSGQVRVQVQVSDTDVSGNYVDPTSGLAQFPTSFQSGGILWINSGQIGGGVLAGSGLSGQNIFSGFTTAAAFQRTGRYARLNAISGDFYAGNLTGSFVSQLKTTGSGGGFATSPTSGTPSV